MSKMINNLILM